ncbi:MAG: hypothetical protein LBB31_03825, partial [Prevotellaceae bacterium]|jgi:hypothetical protein|nr:hypothetical protein [Prevotellaceae bacterium]
MMPDGEEMRFSWYNLVHNRVNITWNTVKTPHHSLSVNAGVRNRLFAGRLIAQIPQYGDILAQDDGLVRLSYNLFNTKGGIFNTSLDRLYLDYSYKNIQVKIGRQRINWGIGLVWNPNDIFNAFSYIDFDYEERPGSDAVSFTWYRSSTSSLDAVYKIDERPNDSLYNHTIAARYLFNSGIYDWQVIVGKCRDDAVAGFGWSGGIGKVSFRGEAAVFVPVLKKADNNKTAISATFELDYTFTNSLYLHGAFLFTSLGTIKREGGISLLDPSGNMSAKRLSTGMFELFGNISYPFSPIVNGGLAVIFNPADQSAYLAPTASVSLADNLELSAVAQILSGKENSEYAAMGNIFAGFVRLKYSF